MQIALIIIGAAVFLLFAIAVFDRVLNFGNIAGMLFGIAYIVIGLLMNRTDSSNQKYIFIIALCVLLLTILKMREIYAAGKTKISAQKVIIVLGCRVRGDEPSLSLIKRVDAAYKFLLFNPESVAILSGGQGKDENISEAQCMQQLLYARGISKNRLILENRSTSTDENIRFSLQIIETLDLDRNIAIATSEYHQKRAANICKKYGLNSTPVSSKTKWTLLPTFLLRELFAEIKEKLMH